MLISIVTAVLNRANTIGSALDSLAEQSYSQIEHVVQDGMSSDGTLDILRKKALPDTKLVCEVDSGIYDALNRGLARTGGDVSGISTCGPD